MNWKSVMAAGVMVAAAAAANGQDTVVDKAGPFTINRIMVKGKLDRCAATLQPGPMMLRIAYSANRTYALTTPPAPKGNGDLIMRVDMGKAGNYTTNAATDGKRAWISLPNDAVEMLMNTKGKISVDLGSAKFSWPLGTTNLEDVFVRLENCVQKMQGR